LTASGLRRPIISIFAEWKDLEDKAHKTQKKKFVIDVVSYDLWIGDTQANVDPLQYEREQTWGALPDWDKIQIVMKLAEVD
jgi:hypothetical protein